MKKLTLTFDNGPTPGVTESILDILAERGIKSTFFVLGNRICNAEGAGVA
jgi:peptidoglycan-N-acetylglucosamine deacetylase